MGTLKKILWNRVDEYERMLRKADDLGYQTCTLAEFATGEVSEPCLIVRHDIDVPRRGLEALLRVEQGLGVRSSWYFRWCTADADLIAKVHEAGGDVGLHFETLSTLCLRLGIQHKSEVTPQIVAQVNEEFCEEVERFRDTFGVPCKTVAAHGHEVNGKIRIANHELITRETLAACGLLCEAYDTEIIDRLTGYVCDAEPMYNGGWSYGKPLDVVLREAKQGAVCFLSHPHHWQLDAPNRDWQLKRFIAQGETVKKGRFKRAYADDRPDADVKRVEYDAVYSDPEETFSANVEAASWTIERLVEEMAPWRTPGGRALDVGCGPGAYTEGLRRAGFSEAIGIDYSSAGVERAQVDYPECRFHCMDGFRPDLSNLGKFDLVWCRGFSGTNTHDLDFVAGFSNEYIRALKPNGIYVLAFSSNWSGVEEPGESTVNWTAAEIERLNEKLDVSFRSQFLLVPPQPRDAMRKRIKTLLGQPIDKDYFYLLYQAPPAETVFFHLPERSTLLQALTSVRKNDSIPGAQGLLKRLQAAPFWKGGGGYPFALEHLKTLADEASEPPTLLDVGCSVGHLPIVLQAEDLWGCFAYSGTDISEGATTVAAEAFPDGTFFAQDASEADERERYDVVYTRGTLCSAYEPIEALRRCLARSKHYAFLLHQPVVDADVGGSGFVTTICGTGGNAYVFTVTERARLFQEVEAAGYRIRARQVRPERHEIVQFGRSFRYEDWFLERI